MRRPRLERMLDLVLARRVACLVAGAGFGKTTLLSAWSRRHRSVWYRLRDQDRDLSSFAVGLVAALAAVVPELSGRAAAVVAGVCGPGGDDAGQARVVAGVLCDALRECLAGDLVVVLDDVETLGRAGPAVDLVEAWCRQAPASVHLVLASRDEPPFRTGRLRAYGELVELTASELAFDEDETAAFLGAEREAHEVHQVHEATGGWPVAVRLAGEALANASPAQVRRILDGIRHPDGALFEYLAHEVFEQQTPAVRTLVRTAAHLGRVSVELCEALGHPEPGPSITSLARHGLLVRARPGEFALIPPAREFAVHDQPLDDRESHLLHRRAAAWLEEHGDVEAAIESLTKIGDLDRVRDLLVRHGPALLAAGRGDAVLRTARSLPAADDAAVCRLVGEASQVRGAWDEALSYLRRAAAGEQPPRAGTAWRLGLIHYLRGEPERALEAYERAQVGADAVREEALLSAWMASARWAVGQLGRCRGLAAKALELAEECGDAQALAAAHTARALACMLEGDREGNAAHYREAIGYAEKAGDIVQLTRIRTNRGAHFIEEADFERALVELNDALSLAELSGFAAFHALGLHNRGEAYRCLGRLDEAVVDLAAARELYRDMGSHHVCRPLRALGDVYRERGDTAQARAAYEEAVTHARACGEIRVLALCRAGLARVVADEDPEQAMTLAEQALTGSVGATRRSALLAVGRVALIRGDPRRAGRLAAAAAGAARRERDRTDLAESLQLRALATAAPDAARRLLHEAVALWRDIGSPLGQARAELDLAPLLPPAAARETAERVRWTARRLGAHGTVVAAGAFLSRLDELRPAPVAIRTLGRFAVLHDGKPLPATAWQSRKARDLVKILLARRGRPATRAALIDILWPGEDPRRVANRLSVALSTARAVLDPARLSPPHHLVVADADTVRLDIARIAVDVEDFLTDATTGLRRRRPGRPSDAAEYLDRAEAAYRGDFLEADPDADWAAPLREEARAVHVQLLRALAEDALAAGEPGSAVRHLSRVLERDPYDEPAHLAVIDALVRARSHGEARRRYRHYVARMAEIDVEAAPFPARRGPG